MIQSQAFPAAWLTSAGHKQPLVSLFTEREKLIPVLAGFCHTEPNKVWFGAGEVVVPAELKHFFAGHQLLLHVSVLFCHSRPADVYADQVLSRFIQTLPWLADYSVGLLLPWAAAADGQWAFRRQNRNAA